MTLVRTSHPFAKNLDGLVNDIFNDWAPALGKTFREDVFGFPPVNISEKTDAYQLEVAAPGFDKTDFAVKLDNQLLTITAEKKETTKDETTKTIRKEFSHKTFKRSFTLDEKIEAGNISAKYENGILLVTLPKKEEVKAVAKEIAIQ
ncbi:Hsp20/alpha crystallin family protein [Ferruginibacter lapsinanis]|uniref:Hsp20/alpha crystallin family protein n=1 Tax=Ferruginibacter lapsinanis TaxID=563172 RepID=UPI001E64AA69|nr:Hsp20/alpha crystallin family protein [Ferruginibacter lapsinanis]UEG49790.1 Hsp20/alpha crystallin family protein [Ferruginibacter lapsinanis]